MSTLFLLLVYYIIILISALYNPSRYLFVRANRGNYLCLIWLYKIALKTDALCCCLSALENTWLLQFFSFFLLMLYMQKTGLCVSCYLGAILALYMHQFYVTGPFKYKCYDEEWSKWCLWFKSIYTLLIFLTS